MTAFPGFAAGHAVSTLRLYTPHHLEAYYDCLHCVCPDSGSLSDALCAGTLTCGLVGAMTGCTWSACSAGNPRPCSRLRHHLHLLPFPPPQPLHCSLCQNTRPPRCGTGPLTSLFHAGCTNMSGDDAGVSFEGRGLLAVGKPLGVGTRWCCHVCRRPDRHLDPLRHLDSRRLRIPERCPGRPRPNTCRRLWRHISLLPDRRVWQSIFISTH